MPDSQPAAANRAVFLSYTRQDADAARRIADALRAFGVEVWFDQSELQGGDGWDQKIKKQIRECALFVPLISKQTQERAEGYFRREWNLAVERTLDMAHGTPFLLPVVLDETAESAAVVPEQFLRVQWTRLPQGLPSPQFIEQLKRLLAPAGALGQEITRPSSRSRGEFPAAPAKLRMPLWAWAALAVAVGSGVLALILAQRPAAHAMLKVNEKSVAVLPFTNMSDDRENAYFADGIHEDILTNMAMIRELRVVSRTSVMQYRETKMSVRQIGEALGVAYVVEGSVRGRGNKVRVSVQLIDARTDEHIWATSYNRDLSDIFAIQAELATNITTALQAAISPASTPPKHG